MSATSTESLTPEQINLETTVMAIRENVMSYFKGTCIERVTRRTNINLVPHRQYQGRLDYQYERRRVNNQNACFVMIGGLPILTLQLAPAKIIFYEATLTRSPQLKYVYKEIEKFSTKYLSGIEREVSTDAVTAN